MSEKDNFLKENKTEITMKTKIRVYKLVQKTIETCFESNEYFKLWKTKMLELENVNLSDKLRIHFLQISRIHQQQYYFANENISFFESDFISQIGIHA